jgi:adenylate kinase
MNNLWKFPMSEDIEGRRDYLRTHQEFVALLEGRIKPSEEASKALKAYGKNPDATTALAYEKTKAELDAFDVKFKEAYEARRAAISSYDTTPPQINLVFFGPPGSGKGTQAQRLHGFKQLSTGEMLRTQVRAKTPLGLRIESILKEGHLVHDDIVIEMIESALVPWNRKVIFDGFPRTVLQAQALEKVLCGIDQNISQVINLVVDEEILLERITKRFEKDARSDDNPEAFVARMAQYHRETLPVLDYYRASGLVVDVDGMDTIRAVEMKIRGLVYEQS